jgi:putative peptidoglycan lipid II flippase
MLKRFFDGKSQSIITAAVIIALANLASRVLGLLRDRILAGEFGAGTDLDIYYAAFRIPDLVFNLIVMGALSAGFIPVFCQYLSKLDGNKRAWRLVNNVLNTGFLLLVILSVILIIFTPPLIQLITPGFDQEQLAKTADLSRIMFLSPLLLGISSLLGGILQSFKRFFAYSLAPVLYNVGIIIGALFFVNIWQLKGLAYGVVLGALLHLLIQLPSCLKLGFRYQPLIDLASQGLRKIGKMMIPRTLALAIAQINLLVITIIASTLSAGSITIFNLANNLQFFAVGFFGISLAVAAFPTLSEYAGEQNQEKFIKTFSSTSREILFFMIPVTVIFLTLRAQIVRVVLGSGRFDWQDTILTFQTLGYFSISLFAQALIPLVARAFFAFHNTVTPFVIGLMSALVNILLCYLLAPIYGVAGLALAFSLSSVMNLILLWVALRFKLGSLDDWRIVISVGKISGAAFFMALVIQAMKYFMGPITGTTTFLGIISQAVAALLAGSAAFIVIGLWLKLAELQTLLTSIKRKIFRQKFTPSEIEVEEI